MTSAVVSADHQRPIPRFALRPQEAADSIGVSLSTFLSLVAKGLMPVAVKVGGVALYDVCALQTHWSILRDGGEKNPWD
jgi:hypothetical protein